MNFIGIDVHTGHDQVALLDQVGEMHPSQRFEAEMRDKLVEFVEANRPCTVTLEACGGAFALVDRLAAVTDRIIVADGRQFRKRFPKKGRKTDSVDATNLALYGSYQGEGVWVPDEKVRQDRILSADRMHLNELRTQAKNLIHGRLREYAVRKPATVAKDLFSRDGLAWLEGALARLPSIVGSSIQLNLDLLVAYDRKLAELDRVMAARAAVDNEVKLIMTIPGIDYWGAFAIKAEIGDVQRFQSAKQLTSYAGLVPRVSQSGKHCSLGRITKRGRSALRWILVECALPASRLSEKLRSLHARVKKRSRMHGKAKVAVGRKLLELTWHILRSGLPYSESDPKLLERKLKRLAGRAGNSERARRPQSSTPVRPT